MRKLTPLMTELLLWLGNRLTGERGNGHPIRVTTNTWVGLMNRGLIGPYRSYMVGDDFVGGHALTTDGLIWLHRFGATGEMRRNAVRKLWIEADHAEAAGDSAEHARIEAHLSGAGSSRPTYRRRPKPAAEATCGINSSSSVAQPGEPCTLPAGHNLHAATANHSWAPADLAPSSLRDQREATAADRTHVAKTRPGKATPDVFDEYGADRRWTYVGPGGLFRLTEGDWTPQVHAVAIEGKHGHFTIYMLGNACADISRRADDTWGRA